LAQTEIKYFNHPLTHVYYFPKENLVVSILKLEAPISYENALSNYKVIAEISNNESVSVLFDARNLSFENVPKEVLSCMANNEYLQNHQKFAILYSGLGQKILGEMYIKIFKPVKPTRMFSQIHEVFSWLGIKNPTLITKHIDFTL